MCLNSLNSQDAGTPRGGPGAPRGAPGPPWGPPEGLPGALEGPPGAPGALFGTGSLRGPEGPKCCLIISLNRSASALAEYLIAVLSSLDQALDHELLAATQGSARVAVLLVGQRIMNTDTDRPVPGAHSGPEVANPTARTSHTTWLSAGGRRT